MKTELLPACALWCLPALTLAQAASPVPPPAPAPLHAAALEVANPQAVVPPVVYRPVLSETTRGVPHETLDWKAANDEVGQFQRGHIDILKWETSKDKP